MSQLINLKRVKCNRCSAPLSRCLCEFTPQNLHSPIPVIILQHKSECNHYLNTAKILNLSCDNIYIFSGDHFNFTEILNTLNLSVSNWYILFPNEKAASTEEFLKTKSTNSIGLIILDGSWKKAKKIFYTNSFLQELPCIKLTNTYSSNYELRVCHKKNHLSTLEAFSYFLTEINEDQIGEKLRTRKKIMIENQKKFLRDSVASEEQ